MFGKYFDVGEKRDFGSAFMFFVMNLVLLVGLSSVFVHFFGFTGWVENSASFFEGSQVHTIIGSLFVLWIGGMIVSKRGMTANFIAILMVIAGLYLAWSFSVILGLVPIALLTTMDK